jgi:uncharacterized membrane protein
MRPTTILTAAAALGALLTTSPTAQAGVVGYTFTEIDVPGSQPGSTGAFDLGINDLGQIVGDFTDNAGTHGFLDSGGNFTTINPPGDTFTTLVGINNRGQILGQSSSLGNFLYAHGTFTPVVEGLGPRGINDLGQIVGGAAGDNGNLGFVYTRGRIATFNVPGASITMGNAINDSGQIVGEYLDSTGFHSFLDTRGVFTTIEPPGQFAIATSINDRGQIAGNFCDNTGCPGFLDTNGVFTTINMPGAIFTNPESINNRGQIVGLFEDSAGLFGSFLATPINGRAMSALAMSAIVSPADAVPEPSTWVMLVLGFAGLGFAGYRTTRKSLSIAT